MTDSLQTNDDAFDGSSKAIAIYVIYIIGLVTAVPLFIGVILAYIFKGSASSALASHYDHQISLFWRFFFGNIALAFLFVISMALSVILIGIPALIVVGLAWVYLWVWMLIRCLKGIQQSQNNAPYQGSFNWRL